MVGGLCPEGVAHFLKLVEEMGRCPWPGRGPEVIVQEFPGIPDGSGYLLGCNLRSPLPGLTRVCRELEERNAGCIAIPCMAAHYFYREMCGAVHTPIIDPMEETARLLEKLGVGCAGILATDATVQAGLFTHALERRGIRAVYPEGEWRQQDVKHLRRELEAKGAEVTVLGCARLSAANPQCRREPGFLDVTEVLAAAALRCCGRSTRPEFRRRLT